jgi:DMSO/TMAO reductase YedYZ molybdopterin-dependent catalytic subunit
LKKLNKFQLRPTCATDKERFFIGVFLIGVYNKNIKNMGQKISTKLGISMIIIIALGAGVLIWQSGEKMSEIMVQQNQQVTPLRGVEVREYKGEKLSSIDDVKNQGLKGVQNIDINAYSLQITGLVNQPKKFTYEQVMKLPKYSKIVELICVEGWNAKILWEGVQVKDLIDLAEPQAGANTVIFYAEDGYTTSLPLDYIKNNNIILADKMNGVILSPAKGFPFQLVAEQKWGYKWIKWVTKIELSNDANYRGYWESKGYNNKGDIDGPELEK